MTERIVSLLANYMRVESEDINLEDSLIGDLGFSSLEIMELISLFEEEFEIQIEDHEIPNFLIVNDLVDYYHQHFD